MACDLEEDEITEGETTGDEIFDSERGTSVNTTPAATPLPPEHTTVSLEPEPPLVITQQVAGLQEHQRPGSELAGISVVMEQPVRSQALPTVARWVWRKKPSCFSGLVFPYWEGANQIFSTALKFIKLTYKKITSPLSIMSRRLSVAKNEKYMPNIFSYKFILQSLK